MIIVNVMTWLGKLTISRPANYNFKTKQEWYMYNISFVLGLSSDKMRFWIYPCSHILQREAVYQISYLLEAMSVSDRKSIRNRDGLLEIVNLSLESISRSLFHLCYILMSLPLPLHSINNVPP